MIRAQEMFKLALAMAVVDSYAAKFRWYRVWRSSPVLENAPFSIRSCKSLVAVARDVPVMPVYFSALKPPPEAVDAFAE
jgi:hypothetical protein